MLIKTKLISGFSVLLVLFILSALSSVMSLDSISSNARQIQNLDSGLAYLLKANISMRNYVASQSDSDANEVREDISNSVKYFTASMAYDVNKQYIQQTSLLLEHITNLETIFVKQENEISLMKGTVVEAIAASGKAFNAVTTIVDENIAILQRDSTPLHIEAVSYLDKIKGTFLLGRNQFTTFRLTNSDSSETECLRLLNESLEYVDRLGSIFRNTAQHSSVQQAGAAITEYKNSFEKFVAAQKRMLAAQESVHVMIEEIRKESHGIIDACVASKKITQEKDNMFTLVSMVMAIILCIIVAYWVVLSTTRPMMAAMKFANLVASGDFEARWQHARKDEFGNLSSSLNRAFSIVAAKVVWYEGILNAIKDTISVTDMDMRWTFANQAALDSMGKAAFSEITGKHCSEKQHSLCNTPQCGIEQLRIGNPKVQFTTADNSTFEVTLSYLHDVAGNRIGHVEVGKNITEQEMLRKQAIDALARARQEAVAKLEGVVEIVSSASTQLAAQVEESKRGAAITSERITETATAMEEMNATVLEVARSAGNAASVSNDAKLKAEHGADVVEEVVKCILEVERKSSQLKVDMLHLGQQAESIGTIMNVISDIADQTNLLALNAAIEAARAGEAGRGFAVVADEVRNLAEKTVQATVEVARAIKGVQQSTTQNMQGVDESTQVIATATALVRQAGSALKEIVHMVDSSADQVHTIATAAEEQSATSEEINRALGTVNGASSETARAMTEAVQAVSELSEQAQTLSRFIDEMKRDTRQS